MITNNNRLPVVTGRYENISTEGRLCMKCKSNAVGDEFHKMLQCPNENIVKLQNKYIPYHYGKPNSE